jgi:hypothetical protein
VNEFCRNRANWEAADCIALREMNAATTRRYRETAEAFREEDERRCANGDAESCDDTLCPMSLVLRGSAGDVRACSRSRNLPSTPEWAQVDESNTAARYQARIICLSMVEFVNPIGERVSMRPSLTVDEAMSGGAVVAGFTASSIRRQNFPTVAEAASAGCVAAAEQMRSVGRPGN